MVIKNNQNPLSKSYLLRVWEETPGQGWRAILKDVTSGEQIGFASLQQLIAFLEEHHCEPVLVDTTSSNE